ncbi:MAG: LPS export ABC transporter permease LptG [Alphaproteobacteria bacterium]|nr:LPS export ABC transporter permease LptG [Alphaproteobacteria bacterium]
MKYILPHYLTRYYLSYFLFFAVTLMALIYLFDTVELMRRASKFDNVPLGLVLQMGLLKLPSFTQTVAPFIILFAAMATIMQLNRRQELVILRSAGISAWQFLGTLMAGACFLGCLMVFILNPLSAMLTNTYYNMNNKFLERKGSEVAIFDKGFWLRQPLNKGYLVLNAQKVNWPEKKLENIIVYNFTADDNFIARYDAEEAYLGKSAWALKSVAIHKKAHDPEYRESLQIPTSITQDDIEGSFARPETVSFWALPQFITTLKATGFDARPQEVYFQYLLAVPFTFITMVLLAACVTLRPPRDTRAFLFVIVGVLTGFCLFFFSSVLQAFGISHQLPPVISAWTPPLITFLGGVGFLVYNEDG